MNTKQIIETTKQLIRIPSTYDNPEALQTAVNFLAKIVAACPDVTIERFERNGKPSFLAYRGPVRPATFDILLNGHVDVVPGPEHLFKPVEKDGKLYGRGALDMKGTSAVLTDVFCKLVHEVPYALGLQIVSDEEIGGYDGVRLHINEGVRAKFVIMGEYANDKHTIYNAARGLCWAEIKFKGKAAHGGHLWNGTNAVLKAGDFAGAILKRYPTPDKETWTTTASIANLSTPNDAYNKVPDSAILKIDFRFTQEDPVFQSRESLEAFIASIDPEAELLDLATFEPAVKVEELNPYVQGLSAAMREVTGKKPQYLGRPASSDGRHFALVNNDIVEFGLYGKNPHSEDEWVDLASFGEYHKTLTAFLHNPVPAAIADAPAEREPLHVKLLEQFIAMPTATTDTKATNSAITFIEQFLKARGMHVTRMERNDISSLYATTKPGNLQPTVLLNAHVDVVPAEGNQYKLLKKNGKFYGRGVMDMKFAIASYLNLVDALHNDGVLMQHDIGVLITADEEIGGRNGVKIYTEEVGLRPKVVVVPDGGENWETEIFAKGVQWIKLEATGKASHASRPWEGESAISALLKAIHDIETLIPHSTNRKDTNLTVGTIEGGTAGNQIPATASAMLDIRYGSMADFEHILPEIQKICKAHRVATSVLVNDPPYTNDIKNPYISAFRKLVKTTVGIQPKTCYAFGVTDGRFFSGLGIPCVTMSPECGGRHQADEWLSARGFGQFCHIVEQYVRDIAAGGEQTSTRPTRDNTIAKLTQKLNGSGDHKAYIWYASYGSGLSKANFACMIHGGMVEGSTRTHKGCTDQTPPLRDTFLHLPYALYFSGECEAWGGGHVCLMPEPSHGAHTIARAYLITIEQFEELTAQQNQRTTPTRLPIKEAMKYGHATITDGTTDYDELVYCGTQGGYPMFTITATRPHMPYVAPSDAYARLLIKGLSENAQLSKDEVIEYVYAVPGVAGNIKKQQVSAFVADAKRKP
jgi:succinyl-diaminopimelate desuccinylase